MRLNDKKDIKLEENKENKSEDNNEMIKKILNQKKITMLN